METIGLDVKQIRKLGGGAYTDKQLVTKAPACFRDEEIAIGEGFWSNGALILFEEAPANANERHTTTDERARREELVNRWQQSANIPVYPVEIREDARQACGRSLKFSDGNGTTVWADPRYVNAILKRAGKKASDVSWFAEPTPTMPFLKAQNGRVLGILAATEGPKEEREPEWSFKYTGPFPDLV